MKLNFDKLTGLVPAIVQDADTGQVLMLGYMNVAALEQTLKKGLVTFYSRSRQCLWTKGETSGNILKFVEVNSDCDNDTLLVQARPTGPVCHTGSFSCFDDVSAKGFVNKLETLIESRRMQPIDGSYTSELFAAGPKKIAQKVGEEAVELILEAESGEVAAFKLEAADLLYHFLVLLSSREVCLEDIEQELLSRNVCSR